MIQLRNNQTTEDPRLDRLIEFDERSRAYPVRELLEAKKPRSYTWRCPVNLDQGREGACVGFAWAHELAARPKEVKGLNDDFARRSIYWEAQKKDPWNGGAYPGASPFYEGTSVLAGVKVIKELGLIIEYRWAFSLDDALRSIGHIGPGVAGLNWKEGMFRPDKDGYIHNTGSISGGHAVLVYGVNWKGKYIKIWNSWGAGWGRGGMCYMSFDDFGALLAESGEFCIPVVRNFGAVA